MLLTLVILGLAALIGTSESQTGCYGDMNKVDTTGASCRTAKAEGLSYCGVHASTTIAERDLHTMNNYKTIIKNAGRNTCVDPAVIAGIISRESHAGKVLKDGWGDDGNGFGLMQVDKRSYKLFGQWNSEAHVLQGTGILVNMIKGIQKKFPRWTKEQQLKGGISAYNAGLPSVQAYDKTDIGTSGNDYANDVIARAKFYKRNGYLWTYACKQIVCGDFIYWDSFFNSLGCLRRTIPMLLTLMILGLAALIGTSESQTGCYGNINNVDTTGASCATASPEGLSYCGVAASEKIAERDLYNMNKYKTIIESAGAKKCVDPAVIAAIISRESHAGTILLNGWGDYGYGFGLMQVDRHYHTVVGAWDSEEHVLQGTSILVSMIQGVQKKFPGWTKDQQLKGGISAYNAGLGNVQTYPNMDIGTTHNDYANDVVARAKYYKRNGY
ncbi:lysozyme g-like protein 2 [Pangshura tecta]